MGLPEHTGACQSMHLCAGSDNKSPQADDNDMGRGAVKINGRLLQTVIQTVRKDALFPPNSPQPHSTCLQGKNIPYTLAGTSNTKDHSRIARHAFLEYEKWFC